MGNTKNTERKPRYKVGQYVLYTMFPEKEDPKKLVKIDVAGITDSEKPRYGILYTQLDLDNLRRRVCLVG